MILFSFMATSNPWLSTSVVHELEDTNVAWSRVVSNSFKFCILVSNKIFIVLIIQKFLTKNHDPYITITNSYCYSIPKTSQSIGSQPPETVHCWALSRVSRELTSVRMSESFPAWPNGISISHATTVLTEKAQIISWQDLISSFLHYSS